MHLSLDSKIETCSTITREKKRKNDARSVLGKPTLLRVDE